jgi:ATP-binding cassette subfamily B protein
MNFLRQFYDILKGRRLLISLSVCSGLLFASANLVPPLLIRQLIQWLTEDGGSSADLFKLSVLLFAVYLVRGLARYGYGRFSHLASYHVMHDLMTRVYRHIQRLPHRFFHRERTGSLISRSINDVEAVEDFIAHGIPETILALVIPVAMMVVLFTLNAKLAFITLIPIPLTAYLVYRYVAQVRQMWRGIRSQLAELVAQIHDNLSGIAVIKSFVQENWCADQIEDRSRTFRDRMIQANSVSLIPNGLIEAGGGLGIVLVIWSGGTAALEGKISVADLFVFIVYLGHIYQPFLQLAALNDVLNKAAVSTERVFELLNLQSDIADAPDAAIPAYMEWNIRFQDLDFGYDSDGPVLHQIDFEVKSGEIVALVGPTGAGKTTVSSLVPRYYDPRAGAVLIGGHDVRRLPLDYLRGHIASVQQDVFLFHGTVGANILFGRPGATDEEIRRAAQAANAEEFILDMPLGYDTLIGERGVRLSGGQKQRLSIARALLKDAPILILDEATSSVDTETEVLIQEAIARLVHNRTTLVIAHRLSTVRRADQIIVLDQGRIAERATHDQLMADDGIYARMVQAQEPATGPLS